MNNIEYEHKKLLNSEGYNSLMLKLNAVYTFEETLQINYYYDNKDLTLYHNGNTLRVRQKANKLTLERKYNKRYASTGERICDENSRIIESLPSKVVLNGNVYFYLGNLTTVRKNYIIDNNIISLDANYYLGKVDYELEVESKNEIVLPEIISQSVTFDNCYDGKYTRFIKAFRKMGLEC